MLTISLHQIRIQAPLGLYSQELILSNQFEADVDVFVPAEADGDWPMVDYTRINAIVREVVTPEHQLLETVVREIGRRLRSEFPFALKVKVALRKLHPPMPGTIGYAQVMFEG